MAVISVVGSHDPNIVDGGPGTVLREANNNNQSALNKLSDELNFKIIAQTNSGATPLDVLNLHDQGVTFPVGTVRNIKVRAWARTDQSSGGKFVYLENTIPVRGNGSTAPALSTSTIAGAAAYDPRYTVNAPFVGHANPFGSTATYLKCHPVITGGEVVIRAVGVTGNDFSWQIEVDVDRPRQLPVGP